MSLYKLPGYPALLLHEATHAAAAWPFADVAWHLDDRPPAVELAWAPETPTLAVYAAHLAPTIVGAILTALTAALLGPVAIAALPSNPFHSLALGLLVAYNWLLYVFPSYGDRHPFAEVV